MGHSRLPNQPESVKDKKEAVLKFIELGCSRQLAAKLVGWYPVALEVAAAVDPKFAWELSHRELLCEITALETIQRAARSGRHPGAVTWLKDRNLPLNSLPADYRRRLAALDDSPYQKRRKPKR